MTLKGVTKMLNAQCVALVDRVVVAGILELEGQRSVVGEVLPVDAGEGLGDESPQPEVTWRDRRMLARRTLTVVLATDDDVTGSLGLLCPLRIGLVDLGEAEHR